MQARGRFTLMTLTIPHRVTDKLKHSLKVLFDALVLFRKTAFFTDHIRGWARGIEVTWSAKSGFHPHTHYIVEAGFIELDALHAAWATCVRKAGGSKVLRTGVDLVGLKDSKGLNEAIGYPFKVQALAEWPAERIIELAAATKGRRLYQACQKWSRRIKELKQEARDFAAIEHPSEVVPFADYLDDLRCGFACACAVAGSVLALVSAGEGLEEAARMVLAAMADTCERASALAKAVE